MAKDQKLGTFLVMNYQFDSNRLTKRPVNIGFLSNQTFVSHQ